MDEILETAPLNFIPPQNTQAYTLLATLSDGRPHHKGELIAVLADDPRSPRQALASERYGCWLIHNVGDKKAVYQLDERHLSGDIEADRDARVIALKRLKDNSMGISAREVRRFHRAVIEQAEAHANYQERFEFGIREKPKEA
ncbi:MAG: hypothetical protein ACI85E_001666 [Marinomonas primoryensis]|jgi:hypothetical protein